MDIEAAKQTFVQESHELLEQMEQNLLILEDNPEDMDSLGALFRAVHTLKGTAGMFQYDQIVNFIHVVENVLDRARENMIKIDTDLTALLLSCHDHAEKLVKNAITDEDELSQATLDQGEILLGQLAAYSSDENGKQIVSDQKKTQGKDAMDTKKAQNTNREQVLDQENEDDSEGCKNHNWHISLRFGLDVLRHGLDPVSFIRYLRNIGTIVNVCSLPDRIPDFNEFEPEACYLGFEIEFNTQSNEEEIRKVFEFVEDDCHIFILPPKSTLKQMQQIWQQLPEAAERLMEIYFAMGALTSEQIDLLQTESPENAKNELIIQEKSDIIPESERADNKDDQSLQNEKSMAEEISMETSTKTSTKASTINITKTEEGSSSANSDGEKIVSSTKDDAKNIESRFIRVDAKKLDQLINLVGELVIASATVTDQSAKIADNMLQESTSLMSRLVSEIRDTTLNIRMIPIGDTFNRYKRVVRDLSHEKGKDIQLVINGGETELDKTIIEKLTDPLTHLIRNAVDHGMDALEKRLELGKPTQGTIQLNAYHDTGSIVIEVSDDGSGFHKERLYEKGIEKGLIQSGQQLTDKELFNLVFQAGFSTAKEVTSVSGRGVGMDVVKRNIESLRGIVDIDSQEDVGTTIRIRLPLTLAIIDGFFVGVGKTTWVVPLDMVIECVEFDLSKRGQGDVAIEDEEDFVNLRGEVLPFLRLRELFNEKADSLDQKQNIVVVQYAGQRAGLLVDRLMGEYQTVIKPLGPVFQNLKGISGATILGSGEVALIIDVPRLVQQAKRMEERRKMDRIAS